MCIAENESQKTEESFDCEDLYYCHNKLLKLGFSDIKHDPESRVGKPVPVWTKVVLVLLEKMSKETIAPKTVVIWDNKDLIEYIYYCSFVIASPHPRTSEQLATLVIYPWYWKKEIMA